MQTHFDVYGARRHDEAVVVAPAFRAVLCHAALVAFHTLRSVTLSTCDRFVVLTLPVHCLDRQETTDSAASASVSQGWRQCDDSEQGECTTCPAGLTVDAATGSAAAAPGSTPGRTGTGAGLARPTTSADATGTASPPSRSSTASSVRGGSSVAPGTAVTALQSVSASVPRCRPCPPLPANAVWAPPSSDSSSNDAALLLQSSNDAMFRQLMHTGTGSDCAYTCKAGAWVSFLRGLLAHMMIIFSSSRLFLPTQRSLAL